MLVATGDLANLSPFLRDDILDSGGKIEITKDKHGNLIYLCYKKILSKQ